MNTVSLPKLNQNKVDTLNSTSIDTTVIGNENNYTVNKTTTNINASRVKGELQVETTEENTIDVVTNPFAAIPSPLL